jgi:hypothetical protein
MCEARIEEKLRLKYVNPLKERKAEMHKKSGKLRPADSLRIS